MEGALPGPRGGEGVGNCRSGCGGDLSLGGPPAPGWALNASTPASKCSLVNLSILSSGDSVIVASSSPAAPAPEGGPASRLLFWSPVCACAAILFGDARSSPKRSEESGDGDGTQLLTSSSLLKETLCLAAMVTLALGFAAAASSPPCASAPAMGTSPATGAKGGVAALGIAAIGGVAGAAFGSTSGGVVLPGAT